MKKTFLFILLYFLGLSLWAQTRLVAHKSHSGTNASFKSVMTYGLGYGLPPERQTKFLKSKYSGRPKLEELIYLSDSSAIRIMSVEYKKNKGGKEKKTTIDTVYNFPLFTRRHAKDSIQAIFKHDPSYGSQGHRVKLTGYDNKDPLKKVNRKKKAELIPVVLTDDHHNPPFDFHLLLLVSCVAIFSALTGLLSWKLYQFKMLVVKT